ncbi:hypothetical protein WIX39_026120 [Variovorax sp. AB1(2024)]|uniref:hypothetical protein n=1 Tax=Variovorax sp. AB1(2024) TaxID=3132214 RepID=UPI0030B1384C
MNQNTPTDPAAVVSRFVDLRVPLWGLVCASCGAAFFIISIYFSNMKLVDDVAEMKIAVKAGNQQVTTLAGEQALLRFRMENIEGEIRSIKAQSQANAAAAAAATPSTTTTPRRFP